MLHLISDHFAIVAKAGIVEIPDACVYYSHGEVDQRLIRVDGVEAFLVHVQRHVEDGPVRLRSRQRELKWGPESAVALQPVQQTPRPRPAAQRCTLISPPFAIRHLKQTASRPLHKLHTTKFSNFGRSSELRKVGGTPPNSVVSRRKLLKSF